MRSRPVLQSSFQIWDSIRASLPIGENVTASITASIISRIARARMTWPFHLESVIRNGSHHAPTRPAVASAVTYSWPLCDTVRSPWGSPTSAPKRTWPSSKMRMTRYPNADMTDAPRIAMSSQSPVPRRRVSPGICQRSSVRNPWGSLS